MLSISIAFLAGVLTLQWCAGLPPVWAGVAVAVAVLPLLRWKLTRLSAMFILGFCWAALRAEYALQPELAPDVEGKTVVLEGVVLGMPRQLSARRLRFLFAAERLDNGHGWSNFSTKVRLDWYGTGAGFKFRPAPGERWQLAVRLKRPHGFSNPGGFDYERWLFQQGIRATGYIRKDRERNRRLAAGSVSVISQFRNRLMSAFDPLQADRPSMAMIRALTIGDRSAISPAQWDILRATGTSHLMAISGLHISLVAGLVFWIARRVWLRCGKLTEAIPASKGAAVIGLVAALMYALLAGFGIPTRRAFIMVSVLTLAIVFDRYTSLFQAIGLAVLVTLLIDPLSVLSAGWWLSFWAVTIIAFIVTGRYGRQGFAQKWINLHVVLAIAMLPLLLVFFQEASLVAPVANIIAVPWVSLGVVPVALTGTVVFAINETAGGLLLQLAGVLLDTVWLLLEWLSRLDFALWRQHAPVAWTLLPAIFGLAVLFMPRGLPGRWTGGLLLLPLLLVTPEGPAQGEAHVTLLDVGQGLAAVVQTEHHTLVYDTGPRFSETFDTGRAVVVPFLRHQGIQRLDTLVVSHGDNDHIGGAASLLAAYPAAEVLSSVPGEVPAVRAHLCVRGQRWDWDGVRIAVLHPVNGDVLSGNNASCVLRITAQGGQSVLLTGDIEHQAEQILLREQREQLPANVLVVPHHGSMTSSSRAFIDAIRPDVALFPSGYRNRYGFPKQVIVDRYADSHAATDQTGLSGALTVTLTADSGMPEVRRYRETVRRYWQPKNNH
ncbi:MAG TPA: DNA internalization-related competence protein ComEC/Rec2 [Gammaproteobacteria bacterium]|nr:DNA internalization-related competence protein ComEC/Rec2 [Gammaproteobacteria bacterium]